MKRMFGMMPSCEVELNKNFKDEYGMTISIEAGKHGWTVIWADGGFDWEDVDVNSSQENFNAAIAFATEKVGKLYSVNCPVEC